ncbi:DNA replication/repair protein RecF [Geminisphaera colitermitum]|uniref:DNA replication/repair protein RecF n=1 Tax=Geminisphaera colitermitum TaxID=1148786 RepID=UPI000158CBBD|nr:DNA replication/repair protein RecF [Geminisphaera colitermitum]
MRLRRITLQNFRNIAFADLALDGRLQFLVGANGQGKTNLLEAAGFVTALRSFRTTDARILIRQGQPEAAIACEFEHEHLGSTRLLIKLRTDGKEVWCDGERISRLADHLGRFPTVVFSSQDQQLVRGAPALRRRWLDLTLSATDPAYLRALQTYHQALAGRNNLLKRQAPPPQLAAFEHPLAAAAAELSAKRTAGIADLAQHVTTAYARIADHAEPTDIALRADNATPSAGEPPPLDAGCSALDVGRSQRAWLALFEHARARDLQMRTTLTGPHRDDLLLRVGGRSARDYGSEGQQRCLALALRLAQVEFFRHKTGLEPILLADDVLGELDPARRRRFWTSLGDTRQVIATGTTLPDTTLGHWQLYQVTEGAVTI